MHHLGGSGCRSQPAAHLREEYTVQSYAGTYTPRKSFFASVATHNPNTITASKRIDVEAARSEGQLMLTAARG